MFSSTSRPDAVTREKVVFLADPRHYPHRPHTVKIIETHFAWVFLAGCRAYKLKKPLRQASLDYRTLARRKHACREELRLNSRLAQEVYRRVMPLARDAGGSLTLRQGAMITDWLIEMRRLPVGRMFDAVLSEGTLRAGDLERLTTRLAEFFLQRADRRPMSDRAYRARLRAEILRNEQELCAPELGVGYRRVVEVAAAQLEFLSHSPRTFAGRGARILDGHGDLRPEHVFLGTPSTRACVIDCLEFDARLRRLDPAEEISFLALECVRLRAPRAADELIARYRRATGDPAPPALIHFYMSRRAAIRAQIAAWHLRDEAFAAESRKWRARAQTYLGDALHHIQLARALAGAGVDAYGEVKRWAAANARGAARGARLRSSAARPRQRAEQSIA
jgi:uncharacterized protein